MRHRREQPGGVPAERLQLPAELLEHLEAAEEELGRIAESHEDLGGPHEVSKKYILMATRLFAELLRRAACDREDTKGPLVALADLGIKVELTDPWAEGKIELK